MLLSIIISIIVIIIKRYHYLINILWHWFTC